MYSKISLAERCNYMYSSPPPGRVMSWDRMRRKQEDPKSYEDEHRNRRIGLNQKLKAEFLEIGSRNGSTTELIRISRNKVVTTEFSGKGNTTLVRQTSRELVREKPLLLI